jgi:hypothetical protein
MLTELDDSLWHQLPTTFDHVGTSDPRFFDRYWFAAYAPDGSAALQYTMGAYRNMNVLDAACAVILDGKQYNLRVSRTLGRDNTTLCGPLRVEVVQPLSVFRLSVEDPEGNLHGQIEWSGTAPPEEEAPHFRRSTGRVTEDYRRFNQIGVVRGSLTVRERNVALTDWWGCRDHSWGVRPRMGVPEPQTGPKLELGKRGYTMAFLFFSTATLSGTLLVSHYEDETAYVSGTVTDRQAGTTLEAQSITLKPVLHENTRRFQSVELNVVLQGGQHLQLACASSGAAIAMQGLGYSGGFLDKKGLGVWRDELRIERDIWDVSDPAVIAYPDGSQNQHWHRIQPVRVRAQLGAVSSEGHGSLTLILSGRITSLGLD